MDVAPDRNVATLAPEERSVAAVELASEVALESPCAPEPRLPPQFEKVPFVPSESRNAAAVLAESRKLSCRPLSRASLSRAAATSLVRREVVRRVLLEAR